MPGLESYTSIGKALADVLSAMKSAHLRIGVPTPLAMGRVLSADVVAKSDSPAHSVSHMDGYAVRSSDLVKGGAVRLRVVDESNPESRRVLKVGEGEAVRVSTGGKIPGGADSVVPAEGVKELGAWVEVEVEEPVERGAFVYQAGSDFRKGEVLLREGSRLRAQDIALLLTLGHFEVEVMEPPRVAIIATGSELYDLGQGSQGKVLNTHGPLFANMVRAAWCVPVDLGVCPDDREELGKRIRRALSEEDMVLTLGGTSVGRRDLVADVVEGLGPEVFHHGLRMDRGRVSGVAVVRRKVLVMLPGPVQGAMNAFLLLAVPALEKLRGGGRSAMTVRARLVKPWEARRKFRGFTKVVYVHLSDDDRSAIPLRGETESITVLTKASGYLVVPEDVQELRAGTEVDVNLLPGLSYPA